MDFTPEQLELLRQEGRRRRRMRRVERNRRELGGLGIIDTGQLTDDDVALALATIRAAEMGDEEFPERR